MIGTGALTVAATCLLVRQRRGWQTVIIVLTTMFGGATLEAIELQPVAPNRVKWLIEAGQIQPDRTIEIVGVLDEPPEYRPDGFYLTVSLESLHINGADHKASGQVRLLALIREQAAHNAYEDLNLRCGLRLRLLVTLERTDNFRNPGVSSLTEFLDRKGYDAIGKLNGPYSVKILGNEWVFPPLLALYEWRRRLELEIHSHFSPETAGVLDAAMLGNRYFLSRDAAERFREGGTFHVLVISGLHISLIGGLVLLLARKLTARTWLQFILSACVLWGYTLAVGAESSVVRSALMFSIVALAPVLARTSSSLNALGGAGLVLLLWQPEDLFDPSFQLTFLSVLAIVVIAIPLITKLMMIGSWQPRRTTPYPPDCPAWLRTGCELIYWSERRWHAEMKNSNYKYQLFKTPMAGWLERRHLQTLLRHAMTAVIVSVSVQLALLPLLIVYFHRLSVSSLFLNIFVSGLMAMLGVIAVLGLFLAQISASLAAPLFSFANGLNWLMVHAVDVFQFAGGRSLRLPEYSGAKELLYLAYYAPLAVLVVKVARWDPMMQASMAGKLLWSRTTSMAIASQLVLLAVLVFHPLAEQGAGGRLRVDFLDVGQGDAALVTMPDGVTLLIDGGGRPTFNISKSSADLQTPIQRDTRSIGEAVVSEYLWRRGLDRVDYVMATHADTDHMDGLNDVLRNFQVRSALVARIPNTDPEYLKFAETLRVNHVPANIIGSGDILDFGEVRIVVLWPPFNDTVEAQSRNNDSIVIRLDFGERSILMTGDVEREGEAAILHSNATLKSDVVKVPHHGSKTSSTAELVGATRPQLAVISVGLRSMFGHPKPEIVERWKSAGAEVMTTGRKGTITVSTDGKDLRVETFVK
jgi:competence protein ComEC